MLAHIVIFEFRDDLQILDVALHTGYRAEVSFLYYRELGLEEGQSQSATSASGLIMLVNEVLHSYSG